MLDMQRNTRMSDRDQKIAADSRQMCEIVRLTVIAR
jgi:hypothetical protein